VIEMDEMKLKLSTKFMKGLLAKFISKSIKKKYGYKVDIRINEINLDMFNGDTDLHLDVDVKMNGNEFKSFIESIVED
jgi:hypothetical protein